MALLYIDGFEGYGVSTEIPTGGASNACKFNYLGSNTSYTTLSTTARTTQVVAANSRSLRVSSGLGAVGLRLPDLTEFYFGCGVQISSSTGSSSILAIGGGSPWNASQGIVIGFNAGTGVLNACINSGGNVGAVLGTASGNYACDVWHYIEFRVKLGTTTGEFELRVNGASVLSLTNINTATGSLTSFQNIAFRGPSSNYIYYDDLYVCDTTGSVNNNFLGPVSVYTLMPTGAGSSTTFTPVGAASNWQAVADTAVDTTTYVETNTTGAKDYYTFEDLPSGVSSVFGVAARTKCTTPDNGGRKVRLNLKNGANTITSTLRNLAMGSWLMDFFISDTAPDGSAWTKTSVDSTEVGIEAG